MPTVDLILAVHNHQPVGNFDHVFATAFARAYLPFLAVLERHPAVHVVLHQSGPVWEWMETHHPQEMARLGQMIERGQVELLGGAYYEPILAVIPEPDRAGQLDKLAAFLESRFGVRPRAAWIAERVWEPSLAATLGRAGIESCLLDDTHFEVAGVSAAALDGYSVLEAAATPLGVFPIRRALRYLVPFATPAAALADVRAAAAAGGAAQPVVVLGDDGEKFGLWEGTHRRCYEEGWLDEFFGRLESQVDGVRARTVAEVVAEVPPRGSVELPEASYAEMMEWALPPAGQRALRQARDRLSGAEDAPALLRRVHGAPWRNFLVKYPEARWMHRRMLAVSAAVQEAAATNLDRVRLERARDWLWRAQCGCAYWHGLFGGLYLPHLRDAVYAALVRAETTLDPAAAPAIVAGVGMARCVRLRSQALQAFVVPHAGGALVELDERRRGSNLLDLLSRREEVYHEAWRAPALVAAAAASGDTASATGRGGSDSEPEPDLVYDVYARGACIDHALALHATPRHFDRARLPELAALAGEPYAWRLTGDGVGLARRAPLALPGAPVLAVDKHLRLDGPALEVRYTLEVVADAPVEFLFGVEMAVNLRAGDAPDRYFEVPGRSLDPSRLGSRGATLGVCEFRAIDTTQGLRVVFETDAAVDVWRTPLETVSMSEHGCERVYQGSMLLFVSRVHLEPGSTWTRVVRQSIELR